MKRLFFLLLLLPFFAGAQHLVLVDRNYKDPLQYTDSISAAQLFHQQFPVFAEDIEAIVQAASQCAALLQQKQKGGEFAYQLKAGHSRFVCRKSAQDKHAFHVSLITETDGILMSVLLVNRGESRKKAVRKMNIFIDYLRNNAAVLNGHASTR